MVSVDTSPSISVRTSLDEQAATAKSSCKESGSEPPESLFFKNSWELWWLVVVASLSSTVSSMTVPMYFPALTALADAFSTTVENINLTATIYSVFQGISPLLWTSLADRYGRRPVVISCIAINFAANLALAFNNTYAGLLGLRILQAFGGAATFSLSISIVGDITQRKTRGGPIGAVGALGLIGTCFGPVIGGAIMHRWNWRALFWFLVILAAVCLLCVVFALPETARNIVGRGTITPKNIWCRSPYITVRRKVTGLPYKQEDSQAATEWKAEIKAIDAFEWVRVLTDTKTILVLTPMSLMYTVWYMVLTAQSTILASSYGLTTSDVGLTYLSSGLGAILSSLLSGRLMQYRYAKSYKNWEQEQEKSNESQGEQSQFNFIRARLGLNIFAVALMIATTLIFAWTLDKHVSKYVPVVMTFFVSACSIFVQSTTNAVLVDLHTDCSATAVGCSNLTRCLLCAAGLAAVDRMVSSIGVGFTFTIMCGFLLLGGICSVFVTKNHSRK